MPIIGFQFTFSCLLILPWLIVCQLPYSHSGQYGPLANNDYFQRQQQQQQQQHQQVYAQQQPQSAFFNQQQQLLQQDQQGSINQQKPQQQGQQSSLNQQQSQEPQQPQLPQQTTFDQQQQQQLPVQSQQPAFVPVHKPKPHHPQMNFNPLQPQQPTLNQQQEQSFNQQPQQQQLPSQNLYPAQQQYFDGIIGGSVMQSAQSPNMQQPLLHNQYYLPNNDNAIPQGLPMNNGPIQLHLFGNLSDRFSFQVAQPSRQVTHLGFNGYTLYILGLGFSKNPKFNYDEKNNLLTILSLDQTTVGSYVAVDSNWITSTTIVSAIDVSSAEIRNFRTGDDNNAALPVSCSISIIRSTFKLLEPQAISPNVPNFGRSNQQSLSGLLTMAPVVTEYLPVVNLYLSSRPQPFGVQNKKLYSDTINNEIVTRTITLERPLTRADKNATIKCQVESENGNDVYLVRSTQAEFEYGPELETDAKSVLTLESEALKMMIIECQIDGYPSPSYVWYDLGQRNISSEIAYYGQQNQFEQYPLRPSSSGLTVFATTKQIQRTYQYPGRFVMQCQAQSRGKSLKQEFIINVLPQSTLSIADGKIRGNSERFLGKTMIISIIVGTIFLALILAIVITGLIFFRRKKREPIEKKSNGEKLLRDQFNRNIHPNEGNNSSHDYRKTKHQTLKNESSSTSHLVETAENTSSQGPLVTNGSSPTTSRNPSYRLASGPVQLSYVPASSVSGFRSLKQTRSYSPDPDEIDDGSVHGQPIASQSNNNRSRTSTPFGSHKSITESLQSLRSNQQKPVLLPMKKRTNEPPPLPAPLIPKRDQRTPPTSSIDPKKDYQHHFYHNPATLRAEQQGLNHQVPSDDEDEEVVNKYNDVQEDSAFLPKKNAFHVVAKPEPLHFNHNQMKKPSSQQTLQNGRRPRSPPPSQKIITMHQPMGIDVDETPSSYSKTVKASPSAVVYAFQEPTEV